MKKLTYIISALSCLCFIFCADDDPVSGSDPGTIHGVVTDFATGEPVRAANVQLRPSGRTALTGNDGRYEFTSVDAGQYNIVVSKADYSELIDNFTITVASGSVVQRDVQIAPLPVVLRLMSGDGTISDISGLNFDGATSIRTFSIFNDGGVGFGWEIINNAEWVGVSPASGTLRAGEQQSVTVTIDRSLQGEGVYGASISVVTTPGSGTRDLGISTRSSTLTLNANPANGGSAARDPAAEFYPWGSTVGIRATAASGYRFANWTITSGQAVVANVNNASTSVILDSDAAAITANFVLSTGGNPGASLAAQLLNIHTNAESDREYVIELSGNENIGGQPLSFTGRSNITIRLAGVGGERIVTLADNGSLFTIGSGVTLVLDESVTLRGRSGNNAPLVRVGARGALVMKNGAKISNNGNGSYNGVGSGVSVATDGVFTMEGGEISGNSAGRGAGLYVADGGYAELRGGKISGNTASSDGGAVYMANGIITMTGGEILSNTASVGGGVYVSGGNFTMDGGKISGNTATTTSTSSGGGGVYVGNGTFTFSGGEISGNTARSGGGVFAAANASVIKTGGTINGYALTDINRNTATAGIANNDRGHAVFINSNPNKRRETTAGPGLNLDSSAPGAAGGWE